MVSLLVHLSHSYNNIYPTILYTVLVKRKKSIFLASARKKQPVNFLFYGET